MHSFSLVVWKNFGVTQKKVHRRGAKCDSASDKSNGKISMNLWNFLVTTVMLYYTFHILYLATLLKGNSHLGTKDQIEHTLINIPRRQSYLNNRCIKKKSNMELV